ncbi:MAG: LPS-assembly protein LptD [Betaproteobacteria bacterium]|nr:LPS-assembly protein LptD [Betaproteobacteria bacterium]
MYFAEDAFLAHNVEISSCKPESRDWVLRAEEVRQKENGLLARGAWLYARGVPAFYLPAVWVNTGDTKQSGLLPPAVEYSGGGRIRLPYYFFLAENYDATITPEWLGGHGFLVGGDFRYLAKTYGGDAHISWNPGGDGGRGRQRIAHNWKSGNWRVNIAADNVSDDEYFSDFSDDSALLAARNLPRRIFAEYAREDWSGSALVESIKTLDYAGTPPPDRLPQLRLRRDGGGGGFFWHSEWEWTRFVAAAAQNGGGRWLWRGAVRRRFSVGAAELTPESGVHAAKYPGGAAFLTPFARIRAESAYYPLPGGGNYRLRAAYAYAPESNQNNAPVYDTALRELSAGGIYDWNRFSGGDRASDASVAAYGAEMRFWDAAAGRERVALEIAQRYYFRRPRLVLENETSPPERGFANLLAELRLKSGRWKAESNAEWSPADNSFESVYADVRADFGGRLLRLGGLLEEEKNIIAGGAFPLGRRADFSFLLRYILDDDRVAEANAALAVRGECGCWKFYLQGKNLITAEDDNKVSYSFGLELTGLGKMGGNGYDKIAAELR